MPFEPDSGPAAGRFVPDEAPADSGSAADLLKRGWSAVSDLGASALGGLNSAAKLPAMAIDRAATGQWFGPGVEALNEFGESIDAQKSADLQRRGQERQAIIQNAGRMAQSALGGGDGVMAKTGRELVEAGTSAATILKDPVLLSNALAGQLGTLGVSRIGGRAADATARGAAAVAPALAGTRIGQAAVGGAATAGAVGTGAALQGADSGGDAHQRLMALPDKVWAQNPEFVALAQQVGPDEAKARLANDKAFMAAFQAGAASILSSMLPGGAALEKALVGKATTGAGAAARAKAVGGAFVGEARQEGIEEGFGRLAANEAVGEVDPTQDRFAGVGSAVGEGGALGGLMGGGMTAARIAQDMRRGGQTAAPPAPRGADAGAINADEVLGAAPPAAPAGPGNASIPQGPGPTDAEKALANVRPITSLDRVQAIDGELAKIDDLVRNFPDQVTDDAVRLTMQLRVERAQLSKDWPAIQPGLETTFTTEAGARLSARYALVEADDLQSSHDEGLRVNPRFPPELQPRQRERAASAAQIAGIVGKLDPARLGASPDAANGAPIIGADGLVESGNARSIALKRVYQANGQKALDYKAFIRDNAAQFGVDPAALDTMRKPVLVRVRTTPVDRAEFARQANADTVARMSPSEQARSDAARVDSMEDLSPDEQGDFATSRDFIRRFMARLPATEQSGMVDAEGRLSSQGYARVRNAVLAKAYGDSPVLTRMVESMDDNLRNISRALMIAAPRVAKARSAIADGRLHDADLTPHLVGAAEWLSRIKDSGNSVDDTLAQAGLLGDDAAPEARDMLRFLADNVRRPRKIADFITAYFDALDAAGDPAQGDLMGETKAPTTNDLMGAARRDTQEPTNAKSAAADAQRGNDREAAPAGPGTAGQPTDAPGGGRGNQGDGAAGTAAANEGQGPDWQRFGPETGTLGIPRAEMPQVAIRHRAAMLAFVASRGVTITREDVQADELKPTQAEYSRKKVERSKGLADDRSDASAVLMSSDGYVLDGHHRWLAKAEEGQPVNVIKFDKPIRELIGIVREFSGTTTSDESSTLRAERAKHVEAFYDAAGDLVQILTKHQRAAMVPENTPGLMPTLVSLFVEGIQAVGTNLKMAKVWVRDRLKSNPATKHLWNKVSDDTYRKAALLAMAEIERTSSNDLFSAPELARGQTGDLFAASEPVPEPVAAGVKLLLGDNPPPKGKPVVLVFGGTFNPTHNEHVAAAKSARKLLTDAGYKVKTVVVSPSPQRLMLAKSGAASSLLVDRTAMAKLAFEGEPWAEVTDKPSREADAFEGKLKRTQQADWVAKQHPDATIVSLTGQDSAPGNPPGYPSVYQGDPGTSHAGYYYLAVPRDEGEGGVSSSKIRAMIEAGQEIDPSIISPKVVDYFKATKDRSGQIALDGKLYDLDAPHFGMPKPGQPTPDGDPLLTPTDQKSTVNVGGKEIPRSVMWQDIEDERFSKVKPPTGRKPIAYVMGGGGASGKGTVLTDMTKQGLVNRAESVHIDPDDIKASIPEYVELLARKDSRAAAVVHEESSDLGKRIKKRALDGKYDVILDVTLGDPVKGMATLQELKDKGYDVRLFGVVIDPRIAVMRALHRANDTGRYVPMDMLLTAHKGFAPAFEKYAEIADEARLYEHSDGRRNIAEKVDGVLQIKDQNAYNEAVGRTINERAQTLRDVLSRGPGAQAGRTDGRAHQPRVDAPGVRQDQRPDGRPENQAPTSPNGRVDQGPAEAGNVGRGSGGNGSPGRGTGPTDARDGQAVGGLDVSAPNDRAGAEGPGAKTARGAEGGGQADTVPAGTRERGQQPDRVGGDVDPGAAEAAVPGEGAGDEQRGSKRARDRAGPGAGRPAGREIQPKSGLNYRFTDNDISPKGSWQKRAEWNIDAVELIKKLQTEGRQATRDEQAVLAKFVGWGAGELSESLFGDKHDKAADLNERVNDALGAMREAKRDWVDAATYRPYQPASPGYHEAVSALRAAGKVVGFSDLPSRITRAEIEAVRPPPVALRWLELRDRLKAALTPEEWAEAKRSTQYGHYTSAPIVRGMWSVLERFGFKGGLVLEPGAGKGNFPGLMPVELAANTSYTGIEFDAMTGAILRQLHPDERILVESYVDTKLPKDFFDVGIGNPPFAGFPVLADPAYRKHGFSLHDYFFAKTIDRVRPGGLLMFVTSRYTMDKQDDRARAYLSERADLVGAIRLPQTAFKENAGTDVVTDILFLRKKVPGETFEGGQAWANAVPRKVGGSTFPVNEYYHAHPEMILGSPSDTGSMANSPEPQYTVLAPPGDIADAFATAAALLPADVFAPPPGSAAHAAKVREIDLNPKAQKEGNFYVTAAGVLMQREGGIGQEVLIKAKGAGKLVEGKTAEDVELIKGFVPLRDAIKQAQFDQLNGGDWESSLKTLQAAYKAFTDRFGAVNQSEVRRRKVMVEVEEEGPDGETVTVKVPDEVETRVYPLLSRLADDPDYTLVAALESVNEETGEVKPADNLSKRVLGARQAAQIATPHDAMLTVLNDVGRIDIDLIADRLDLTTTEAIEALGAAVYLNPQGEAWETSDQYLSGNVKRKLAEAQAAAKADRRYARNVAALEAVQPPGRSPADINITPGMNWVPGDVYELFLKEVAGVDAAINFNETTRKWSVRYRTQVVGNKASPATVEWGTNLRHAGELMDHALTGRKVRVTKSVGTGSDKKTVFDPVATEAANAKLSALKEEFARWVWRDAARTTRLITLYNDKFNTDVPRSFDGRHLTLPGSSALIDVYDHVKRGAWRIIQTGNAYLAHAVGSGKTWATVISAMEQRRLGLVKKPMFVVPNHMLGQFAREWVQLYPTAKLMVADEANFTGDNRRRFVARAALSDLDGIIITHDSFKKLDLDPAFKARMIGEQINELRAALEQQIEDDAAENDGKKKASATVKRMEKRLEGLEQKLAAAMSGEGKDQNVRLDQMGVDMLYVDEAHVARKLDINTSRQVKGVSTEGSQFAMNLYMASRWLEEKNPGRNLVLMSGTPITNTMGEMFTAQRFLGRQAMADKGVDDFDSWASMFGREVTSLEPNAAGQYQMVTRFKKFVNMGELTSMFREFADVLNADHLAQFLGDKRPKVKGGSRKLVVTPLTPDYRVYRQVLAARYEASKNFKPAYWGEPNPDPVIAIIGDGRLAAIDMRFIDPELPSDPNSKLNQMIDGVIQEFKASANLEYRDKAGNIEPRKGATMMVFSDLGFGEGVAKNRGFNARAWFEKRLRDAGVPPNQVAWMSDHKLSSDKVKLFRDVNAGAVRLLIGSSKNMGTGVNAQQRLLNLFHLDTPWFPADVEQREGRAVRQGNKNPVVAIHAYAAKGTYDEQMWKLVANKQTFIDQALSGDPNLREIDDMSEAGLADQASAMLAEDPRVLQAAGMRAEIDRMQRLYQAHEDQRQRFRDQLIKARREVEALSAVLPKVVEQAKQVEDLSGDKFKAKADGKSFTDRAKWAQALKARAKDLSGALQPSQTIGTISGFPVRFVSSKAGNDYQWVVVIDTEASAGDTVLLRDLNDDDVGLARRATYAVADVAQRPAKVRDRMRQLEAEIDALLPRLDAQFQFAETLAAAQRELAELEKAIAAGGANDPVETIWGNMSPTQGDPAGDVVFSRGSRGGMPYRELLQVAARVARKLPGLPNVEVLRSPADAPQALQAFIQARGAMADVEGALHDGTIYLFASGLADAQRAEHVLAEHEAAHAGLRATLGERLRYAMQLIHNENQSVRKLAAPLIKGGMSITEAVEEVIVDIPSAQLARLKGWRKVVGKVRDALAARGFEKLAAQLDRWLAGHLPEQQRADLFVADLVREARAFVARKSGAGRPAGTVLASSQKLSDDLAAQEQWLQAKAKAAGHADIEALLEADYPLFERLAAQWREEHPVEVMLSRRWPRAFMDAPSVLSEQFKRWLGNSVAAYKGKPVVMYHSTTADFSTFKPNDKGLIFVASKAMDAERIAAVRVAQREKRMYDRNKPGVPDGLLTVPVFVSAQKPFDHQNAAHADELLSWLDRQIGKDADLRDRVESAARLGREPWMDDEDVTVKKQLRYGNYLILEDQAVIGWMRDNGYDSFWTAELDDDEAGRTLALFRPNQLKSAFNQAPTAENDDMRLSRAAAAAAPGVPAQPRPPAADRANTIIQTAASTPAPIDALFRGLTRVTGINRATGMIYGLGARLIDRVTPETVKAGVISDYGVPEAVIDRRALMVGGQRMRLASAGKLLEKLATLTRAESRVAYEWMNMNDNADPHAFMSLMQGLPEESVAVLQEVQQMIDSLSQEAVRLGQLEPEAFKRHRFAYLRRSYVKHTQELNPQETAARAGAIRILGDQYKGRGMVKGVPMKQVQNVAPDWWKRKMVPGKADTSLKGEKFERLERRAPAGAGTNSLPFVAGQTAPGRILEVHYWPVGEPKPAKYRDWDNAGTWEVRDTKAGDLVMWRDFTKEEREKMGEIDEARFAIAKTLHGMIHDIEVGSYLEWLAQSQSKADGDTLDGPVVAAGEKALDTFKPGTWVQVPDAKIPGTSVARYGKLAGRYIPGPVWSDLRQIMGGGRIGPEWYRDLLRAWKTSKTALSPGVHTNNVMSNLVMADWHDVTAGHVAKSLRIILAANDGKRAGALGAVARGGKALGIDDAEAAREIMARYEASGGAIGSWVSSEIAKDQLAPIVELLQAEVGAAAQAAGAGDIGVYSALQHVMHGKFPAAWESFKGSRPAKAVATDAGNLIDLYQAEDDVFRLAAWLKAKEGGASDAEAGKRARKSFLDYSINAPWISALRQTALPFVAFTYRAVPMLLETAAKRPHKLIKLMMLAGALNALGVLIGGGGDDKERKLLPEEKAGRIWGMVPKLIRMPWNDAHGSPVYLDIRRWIPVGDVIDTGQGHAAMGLPPVLMPGGPLALLGELIANKSMFTGDEITLETDTALEKTGKIFDHLYKAFAPNFILLPGTYAFQGVVDAYKGKTDKFGREQSVPMATVSAFGLKLGAYPEDVLRSQVVAKRDAQIREIDKGIAALKRQLGRNGITQEDFDKQLQRQLAKEREIRQKAAEQLE